MGTSHRRWDLLDLHAPHYRLTKDRKASEGWKPRQSEAWDYPIDSFTVARLRNRKELYARPGAEYVFPSPQTRHTGAPIGTAPLGHLFEDIRVKLGLPANFTPNSTRRTRTTYCDALFGNGYTTDILVHHQVDYGRSQTGKYIAANRASGTARNLRSLGDSRAPMLELLSRR